MAKKKITKDMTIGELIDKYPEAVEILFKEGLMCVMCHRAKTETLAEGASAHGMDLNELLKKLNKAIK